MAAVVTKITALACLWAGPETFAAAPLQAAEPAPAVSAAESAARGWVQARIHFTPFAFVGEAFPSWKVEPESAAEAFFGTHQRKATFWRAFQTKAEQPADVRPYLVQLDFAGDDGRKSRRWATVFKLAEPLAADETPTAASLARAAGIDAAEFERERLLVEKTIQGRKGAALVLDPQFARLLAGMWLQVHGRPAAKSGRERPQIVGPARRNADPFAWERDFVVGLKLGAEEPPVPIVGRFPEGADAPRRRSSPAPVVREGTFEEAGVRPDAAERIDAACRAWAADTDQAFSICVVRRGVVVVHRAYGERDGRPLTLEDRSWMASVTKTMSAAAAMILVDRGLFALDDPVASSYPPLTAARPRGPAPQPITWRHCFTHTAGLSTWPLGNDESPDLGERAADALPFVRPGEAWAYNGQSYSLAWKAMERRVGCALPTFQLRALLTPLGMERTDVVGAHADMQSTPLDMARFGQMLLNKGSYGDWEFFRPETFEAMLPEKLTKTLGAGATKTFGVGLDGAPGSGRIGHGTASAATFSVDLKDELVVVMCRNAIGKNFDKYNGGFWKAIEEGIVREPK